MTRAQFWILNVLSVVVALAIAFELHSQDQLEMVTALVQQAQAPLVQEQQQVGPLAQQLMQRVAQGSLRDPALKDLLAKYGFQVSAPAALSVPVPATTLTAAPVTTSNP